MIKIIKVKGSIMTGKELKFYIKKEITRGLPDFFYADIIIENIEERGKNK